MKKLFLGILLYTSITFLAACSHHYSDTEPTYIEAPRPMRPSPSHVWVEGNWHWNRKKQMYNQSNGHWVAPKRHRNYQPGRWKTNRRGHYWSPGRWK